jgi:hypothetical protein
MEAQIISLRGIHTTFSLSPSNELEIQMGIRKANDASELQMGTRKTDACANVIPKHVPDGGTFLHFNRSVLKSQVRTF